MQSIIRTATLLLSFIALTGFGSVSLPSVASAADITKKLRWDQSIKMFNVQSEISRQGKKIQTQRCVL